MRTLYHVAHHATTNAGTNGARFPCRVLVDAQNSGDGAIQRVYHDIMPKLLLNLRNAPDDEADDVRALLDAKRIAFYETTPSLWGISSGGIWVTEDADYPAAKRAFDDYEQQRSARVRDEYAAAKRAGTAETFLSILRGDPLRVVMVLLGILIVLGLATLPFILL